MRIEKENFDLINFNSLLTAYNYSDTNIMVGLEIDRYNDLTAVVYDVSEMLEVPTDIEDFYSIVKENALDEEDFKIDLYTIVNNQR